MKQPGTDDATGGTPGGAPGSTVFATSYGDKGEQTFQGVTSDAKGNYYVAGYESPVPIAVSSMPGSAGPLEGSSTGIFVLKYGPSGELLWRQTIPDPGSDGLLAGIAVQPTTGDVILGGDFGDSLTIGTTTLISGIDPTNGLPTSNVWVAALDESGTPLWARSYPSTKFAELSFGRSVFTTANGDIELFGSAAEGGTVGGAPLCCGDGVGNSVVAFAARYSPGGDFIWSTAIGGGAEIEGQVDAAADGGMVLGGSFGTSLTINGETVATTDPSNPITLPAIVLRLDPLGQKAWAKVYPGGKTAQVGAAFDPASDVVLFGGFSGTIDFGNGVSLTAGNTGTGAFQSALLAKLGPDGTALWAKQFPASGNDQVFGTGIRADAAGNIAFIGTVSGALSVGGAPPLPAGESGDFVAKYAPDGTFLWSRAFAIAQSYLGTPPFDVTFDPSNALGVAGDFDNTFDFGTGPLTVHGQPEAGTLRVAPVVPNDVFLVKLAP